MSQRHVGSPWCIFGTILGLFDGCTKYPHFAIRRAGSQDGISRMPIEASNSGSNRFLYVLGNPPVVLLFKIAHRHHASARSDGKLVLYKQHERFIYRQLTELRLVQLPVRARSERFKLTHCAWFDQKVPVYIIWLLIMHRDVHEWKQTYCQLNDC